MLRITVELDVYGWGSKIINLGTLEIANRGDSTSPRRGNYSVRTRAKSRTRPGRIVRQGEVSNHPRLTAPVWTLVRKALESMGY